MTHFHHLLFAVCWLATIVPTALSANFPPREEPWFEQALNTGAKTYLLRRRER